MLRDLKSSAVAVIVLTLVFGLAIPAIFTAFSVNSAAYVLYLNGPPVRRGNCR